MAVRTVAKLAAKFGGEAAKRHMNERDALAEAASTPEGAAQVALIEAQRTRRSRNRIIGGIAALSITCTGIVCAVNETTNGIRSLLHDLGMSAPHPETAVTINNVLTSIQLPKNNVNLVSGSGTGSVRIHQISESTAALGIGWLYDHTAANLTNKYASVTRADTVQISMPGNDIDLQAMKTSKGKWAVQADVPTDALSVDLIDSGYAVANGRPVTSSSEGFLTHQVASIGFNDGEAQRIAAADTIADSDFENTCAPMLEPALPAGVASYVDGLLRTTINLDKSLPGQGSNAKLLGELAAQPITVVFLNSSLQEHGQVVTSQVAPSDIALPVSFVPSRLELAESLHVKEDSVWVNADASSCSATVPAVSELLQLAGK